MLNTVSYQNAKIMYYSCDLHDLIHRCIFYCVLRQKYNYNMPAGGEANLGGLCLQEINTTKYN